MNTSDLHRWSEQFPVTPKMPVLFLGHGSPMNAIEENEFVAGFRKVAATIPKPVAILCVSAHWETRGTFVTAMERPRTIHDFGGFPPALYDVQYPAPGSPDLAAKTSQMLTQTQVGLDQKWGLDHGAWSVIKHLYPKADVPVIQMSLDYSLTPQRHYEIAQELRTLRHHGVLIVGSGNLVHNLRLVDWRRLNETGYGFDWALEARAKMNQLILSGDDQSLITYDRLGRSVLTAVPSPDHYLPLLYTLAVKEHDDQVSLFNDVALAGSLTMTSVKIW